MPDSKIPVFTSIPRRIIRNIHSRDFGKAWQTTCIKSWKDAGFRVVSLNTREEIVALGALEPTVEFKEISGNQVRPRITDFFVAAKSSQSEIVGIVNADCMLIPQFELAQRLNHIDGLVIIERSDLSQQTLRPTGSACLGFDGFFFKPASLADVEHDDSWRIGEVWIDYWLPLAFAAAGLKIQTLPAPALLHLNHDLGWDWQSVESKFPRFVDFLTRSHAKGRLDQALATDLAKVLSKRELASIQPLLFTWLKSREPLWTPEADSVDELMIATINASARFPQPWHQAIGHRRRMLLRRTIASLGLRPTLYNLGMVKRR